jgi:hypothetical protein
MGLNLDVNDGLLAWVPNKSKFPAATGLFWSSTAVLKVESMTSKGLSECLNSQIEDDAQ